MYMLVVLLTYTYHNEKQYIEYFIWLDALAPVALLMVGYSCYDRVLFSLILV